MARLPILNRDTDQWGAILNEFLRVSHREDGTLKKACEIVCVLDFGAVGDGVHDDTTAIQAALNAAKGADNTAEGRSVFSLHFPSMPGGFYKVTDTLVIDGTNGLVLHGDGALTQRYNQNATIRWYGSASKPVFQVKGGTGTPSNPNFDIVFRDLTISGYPTQLTRQPTMPSDLALAGIYFGVLPGQNNDTLCRRAIVENVRIANCRFGIWSGNPDGGNTDHATVLVTGCILNNNAQTGILWGTGNAIVNLISCDVMNNGWIRIKDAYSTAEVGANVHLQSGYMDIVSYTSTGEPTDADIYQESGRISIINAWSDTLGYFFYQASASQNEGGYHNGQITGVRHYRGGPTGMTEANTPHSLRIVAPGMFISSCLVYGNIEVVSGLSGRPVFAGINFIRPGATYIGSGVNTERSLTVLGNHGNYAQILLGGANQGVPLTHKGDVVVPQILSIGGDPCLFQVLDAAASGSGLSFYTQTHDANISHKLVLNGYQIEPGFIMPLQADKWVWRIELGGPQGWRVSGYDPKGRPVKIADAAFLDFGGLRVIPLGYDSEVTFLPPKRSSPPSFDSGDYWEGSIYYDTTTKKLRVNIGGSTWVDLH